MVGKQTNGSTPFFIFDKQMYKDSIFKYACIIVLLTLLPLASRADDFTSDGLTYTVTSSSSVRVTGCDTTYSDSIVIPASVTYNGSSYYVTSIGKSAFSDKTAVKSIEISNCIDSIYAYAFANCTGLSQLIIPTGTEYISSSVFSGCKLDYLIIKSDELSAHTSAFTGLDTSTPLFYNGENIKSSYISARYSGDIDYFYSYNSGTVLGKVSRYGAIASSRDTTYCSFECYVREVSPTGNIIEMDSVAVTEYNGNDTEAWTISFDSNTHHLSINGMEPGTSYSIGMQPYKYYKSDKFWSSVGKSFVARFTTDDIILTTEQPKVLSSTSAYISATTSLPDTETSVGFEWRKMDAPDEVASKSTSAEIYDGVLAGVVKNLNESTYYKYRAYYKSASDSTYYSDWVGIDTDDYSYFEPTVKTGTASVDGTTVQVSGYALQGTDDITEQGFEYWTDDASSTIFTGTSVYSNVQTVVATGQKMSAELTDLAAYTTYNVRAYATTASGTTYGETIQFTTGEITGIGYVIADESESLTLYVRKNNGLEIAVTGGNTNECTYRVVSLVGGVVAQGKVDTTGTWIKVAEANALKGVYIVVATDGTSSESKKLFLK